MRDETILHCFNAFIEINNGKVSRTLNVMVFHMYSSTDMKEFGTINHYGTVTIREAGGFLIKSKL